MTPQIQPSRFNKLPSEILMVFAERTWNITDILWGKRTKQEHLTNQFKVSITIYILRMLSFVLFFLVG